MSEAKPNQSRYQMQSEDASRMHRLAEEVRSRVLEMALITARTAGKQLPKDAVPKFVPREAVADAGADAGASGTIWMEIIDNPDGSHTCVGQETDGTIFVELC